MHTHPKMVAKNLEVRKLSRETSGFKLPCYRHACPKATVKSYLKPGVLALGWFSPPPTTFKQILTEIQGPQFFLTITRGLHSLWY